MKYLFYVLLISFLMFGCSKSNTNNSSNKINKKNEAIKNQEEPKGFKSIHERDWEANHKDSLKTKKKEKIKQEEVIRYK